MEYTDWHRLFGLILSDFFVGSPFSVELEKDLSLKRQLLDVAIIRRSDGAFNQPLPDGMQDLGPHNLLTFKSFQDTLDDWTLKELTGYYVNYRKQVSDNMQELLPETDFRLYAVSARFPQKLTRDASLLEIQPGVYDCRRGSDNIRVLVLRQLPATENNAMLHLFSASAEQFRYGAEHYQLHSGSTSTLVLELLARYQEQGVNMPYTIQDFEREYIPKLLKRIPHEELLKELTVEERLHSLTLEKIAEGLSESDKDRLIRLLQSRPEKDTQN